MRTSKPNKNNKEFVRKASGGWSDCVKGNPTDSQCDALANCVGFAEGRFNEIINACRGTTGLQYTNLNCNAENFKERAESKGLKTGSTPRVGAIMCWQKGATLSGSDGAGHVCIVEKVYSNNKVYTSESGYGSKAFWNATRTNDNGRWGSGSAYKFRCFIYLPDDVQKWVDNLPAITPTVERDTTKNQLKLNKTMNVRVGIETTSTSLGEVPSGSIYNWYEAKKGDSSTWYAITSDKTQWVAGHNNKTGENYCDIYNAVIPEPTPTPEPTPQPQPEVLKVGDTVKIIGTGNGSCYGTSNTAYGIGWTRTILKIWSGKKYPYQVGNKSGTTGFYQASALQKK